MGLKTNTDRFTQDIIDKIKSDFPSQSNLAFDILNNALENADYLNNSRYIRCIVFLANKKLDGLKEYIKHARMDPRDVMLWAEYIDRQSSELKRVRDFNNSFEENNLTVRDD